MNDPSLWLDRVAHDLRGPLMPLQTAAYLLRSGRLDATKHAELVDVIERQTRQLARMIDELGDWMRAGQQRLVGPREACDPALLIEYAATGSQLPAPHVEDTSDGAMVAGDTQRLTQLLRILLGYAAANGEAPTVRLERVDDRLRIDVRASAADDTTPASALFEGPQSSPFDGGLGLQLLLAHRIAEAHDGTLEACDIDGQRWLRCELPLSHETATP